MFPARKYRGLHGPALFWIPPFIDTVSAWVDQRIITTNFAAEQTLTSDTVWSMLMLFFWMVYDVRRRLVPRFGFYAQAVSWAAQTGLATSLAGRH